VKQAETSGSFHEKDNRPPEQEEVLRLRKENQQLKMNADLKELKLKLWDYVNWYNHHRIYSALGYQTLVQYRENNLKKVV